VTLQTVRLPTGMLGLNMARLRTVVCFLCSPHRFLPATDQYSENDPLVLSEKLASRHDLSLPRIDGPLSKTAPAGSPLPAYAFDLMLNPSSSPFGLKLPSSSALGGWGGSMLLTRCLIPNPSPSDVHRFPLPFRTFILPAQSALPVTESKEAYLNRQPDFPSLPDSANYH
jgi:hypothetical protein